MRHIGLARGKVRVVPYSPVWPQLFADEKRRLSKALAPYVTEIQHVGSTSIPGLAAKPLIDILGAVESLDDYKKLITPLQSLGYEFMPERVFTDRIFFPKGPRSHRTHHLSLVLRDSRQWQDTTLFRDYLARHKDARNAYGRLKLDLAKKFPDDRTRYTEAKSKFIEGVLSTAKAVTVLDPGASVSPLGKDVARL